MMRAAVILGLALLPAAAADLKIDDAEPSCAVTEPVHALPTYASPESGLRGLWYVNADRTIWASVGHSKGMLAGPDGNKVMWFRPKGTQLQVTGRRLDAKAPPVTADIPCCYGGSFQASGLFFPTEGCWEISAKAGESELTFVTRVRAAAAAGATRPATSVESAE